MIPMHQGRVSIYRSPEGKLAADLTHDMTTTRHYLKCTPDDTEAAILDEAMAFVRQEGWQVAGGSLYWFVDSWSKRLTRRLEKPKRVHYTVIALDERRNYIHEHIWGDIMDIRADGFKTPQEAEERGRQWFSDDRVHSLLIQMSIQERAGESWEAGPTVRYVEKGN